MKIVTVAELECMPEGSVIDNVREVIINGEKHWRGEWCSMYGSYMVDVPQSAAKEWEDPFKGMFPLTDAMKALPAYKALLKIWEKQKK